MPKKCKKVQRPSVFDKLTDSRQYTGSHQHRFDANGKGRGLKGRDRILKGLGTANAPYDGGVIRDIAQIVRPNLRLPTSEQHLYDAKKRVFKGPKKACKHHQCSNIASPTSVVGYCAYHIWREHENTHFPKSKSAILNYNLNSKGRINSKHETKKSTKSICLVKQCGSDRSVTSSGGYCAYHSLSLKGKEDSKFPKDMFVPEAADLKDPYHYSIGKYHKESKTACTISSCLQIRFKMGYCQSHFQEMLQEEDMHEQLEAHAQKKEHRRSRVKAGATKTSAGIFRKLTDPSLYTGMHQFRFDKDGKGKGLNGRDSIPKSDIGYAPYHGGPIQDISQILRQ